MADIRLSRLDDGAAAFLREQAAARDCTPQVVVERLVRLAQALVNDADQREPYVGLLDSYLSDAGLERFKLYYRTPPAA